MTISTMRMYLDVALGRSESPVSKLLIPTVHRIAPDDEEVANITSKQRAHKSRAGSTRAKKGSRTEKECLIQKRLKRELKIKSDSHHSFKHCPLPAPPMLPTLQAGEVVPVLRTEAKMAG